MNKAPIAIEKKNPSTSQLLSMNRDRHNSQNTSDISNTKDDDSYYTSLSTKERFKDKTQIGCKSIHLKTILN